MFTGIIQALGRVAEMTPAGSGRQLAVDAGSLDMEGLRTGDSVAVNGVCLTVTRLQPGLFHADISPETLACTTLGNLGVGAALNLERALRAGAGIGGHFVSGHVDGIGRVAALERDGGGARLHIEHPPSLARYIARKGSICVDGVSLTVNETDAGGFSVQIIPHTLRETLFGTCQVGTEVNLEVDLLARYLEALQRERS